MVNVYACVSFSLHFVCLYAPYRLYNSSNSIITVCAYVQQGSCSLYASTRVDHVVLYSVCCQPTLDV